MKKMTNSFSVSGFVATDATVKNFDTASVARFPLSISRTEQNGTQEVRKSALISVEAWRKNENMVELDCLKKGQLVTVEGYFKPEEWKTADGKKQSRIILSAVKVYPTPDKE